jgi:hypothetical protein
MLRGFVGIAAVVDIDARTCGGEGERGSTAHSAASADDKRFLSARSISFRAVFHARSRTLLPVV